MSVCDRRVQELCNGRSHMQTAQQNKLRLCSITAQDETDENYCACI